MGIKWFKSAVLIDFHNVIRPNGSNSHNETNHFAGFVTLHCLATKLASMPGALPGGLGATVQLPGTRIQNKQGVSSGLYGTSLFHSSTLQHPQQHSSSLHHVQSWRTHCAPIGQTQREIGTRSTFCQDVNCPRYVSKQDKTHQLSCLTAISVARSGWHHVVWPHH